MIVDKKFESAMQKHSKEISEAKLLMSNIANDPVHDIRHINDVLYFAKKIVEHGKLDCDINALAVAVFWHDVGRIYVGMGHEQKSAEMLAEYFNEINANTEFAKKCITAVAEHNYQNIPTTIEGKILRDADTLALLGINRWTACLEENVSLDLCIELLPDLQKKYLELDVSKELCCEAFSDIISILYKLLKKNL